MVWYLEAICSTNISEVIWWIETSDLAQKEAWVISMWLYLHKFQMQPWWSTFFPVFSFSKRTVLSLQKKNTLKGTSLFSQAAAIKNMLDLRIAQISCLLGWKSWGHHLTSDFITHSYCLNPPSTPQHISFCILICQLESLIITAQLKLYLSRESFQMFSVPIISCMFLLCFAIVPWAYLGNSIVL